VPLDLAQAVDGGSASVAAVAFGPLGVAGLVWTHDGGALQLVHSADGSSLSVVRLADHLEHLDGGAFEVFGFDVSADAITVRIGGPGDGDLATVSPQRVLVGTPR
jgi:hypothetical protein